jgi:hypothetical protein
MAKTAWIIWNEDRADIGEKVVFLTRDSAKEAIAGSLWYILRQLEEEWQAQMAQEGKLDDFHDQLRAVANDIRKDLEGGEVFSALDTWREFESEDEEGTKGWFGTVKVEESDVGD